MPCKIGQMFLTPCGIKYSVIGFSWLTFLWDTYLSYRQYKVLQTTTRVPHQLAGVLDQETMDKSRNYNLDKTRYGFVYGSWSQIVSTSVIYFNVIPWLWNLSGRVASTFFTSPGEIVQTLTFVVIGSLLSEVINLPWSIYSNFVIEERHGFNKYTPQFYAGDKVKKFFVSQLIMAPIIAATIYIIRAGGPYFFFYLWVFVFFVVIALMTIYPDFIAPLFDTFTPLPEGELRTKIEGLASSIDFPLKKLYVVEGSKRSSHSNAYFYGFYKNKRIVLFDTLIQGYKKEGQENNKTSDKDVGCTTDEVVGVLAHELGHWKLNHVMKNLVITEVNLFLCFAVFGLLVHNTLIYQAFGFRQGIKPVFLGLVIIFQYIFSPYNEVISVLMICLSRRFEFQADDFARQLYRATDLRGALIKLTKDNLGFPVYDWLYSQWNHSHPPILERLEALGKVDGKKE